MEALGLLFLGMAIVVVGILFLRLHAFLALVLAAFIIGTLTSTELLLDFAQQKGLGEQAARDLAGQSVGKRVAIAFGNTCGNVGILIAMASIIGSCLLRSGAADRIVRSALRLLGEARAPLAFLFSGFVLGAPVYFDTVFYLLIPVGKALALRTKRNYALYVMAICAGATMAHSLVPPTPGPLFVASELNVSIGLMIIVGVVVGILVVIPGYVYAVWANKKWGVPLRATEGTTLEDLQKISDKAEVDLPPLWASYLPIVLPIGLIAGNTLFQLYLEGKTAISAAESQVAEMLAFTGDSNFALTLSALVSLGLMTWKIRSRVEIKKYLQDAVYSAGMIVLITGAGGSFGGILQQTGIGFVIQDMASEYNIDMIVLAFLVTGLVRSAQGSATVAMITAVGILGGAADPALLDYHPVYIAMAIGCGSKIFPWMNDSGFWIICKMSGMTENETIKHFSFLLALMGVAGLIFISILAKLFPLI